MSSSFYTGRNGAVGGGVVNLAFENEREVTETSVKQVEVDEARPEDSTQAGAKLDRKTKFYVYISHFLSAWGDRMWSFGVGLFLINFSPDSLRLTAIYGFTTGGVSLLFGALIGDWVDNTPRLKAARIALVLQNSLVALCAGVICVVIWFGDEISAIWADEGLIKLSHAVIIILAVLSNLASMARKIAVERDWLVEICAKDKDLLASMSSKMRAIDLISQILAPALTGQVMYFTELGYGAVVIASWNLLSVFLEYYLIWKVYESVPALKVKMNRTRKDDKASKPPPEADEEESAQAKILDQEKSPDLDQEIQVHSPEGPNTDGQNSEGPSQEEKASDQQTRQGGEIKPENKGEVTAGMGQEKGETSTCTWLLGKLFSSPLALYRGWRTYMKYDAAFAGLGLAFLYMTVLGFDNITVGFAYSQGLSEAILGGLQTAGALSGILGTQLYPRVRKKIGTERTGLFSLGAEIFCLIFCVASVWAPGSPFDLLHEPTEKTLQASMMSRTCNNVSNVVILNSNFSSVSYSTLPTVNITDLPNGVSANQTSGCNISTNTKPEASVSPNISIWLLMIGIITARCGLWMADLTITQLFLERVVETERGMVGGVQSALNRLMDMVKFLLVIIVPHPHQFGLLVLISFSFICMAWMLYARFSYKARGHLLPHQVKRCCDAENNNMMFESGQGRGGVGGEEEENRQGGGRESSNV